MAKSGLGSFEGSAFYCAPAKNGKQACRKVTGGGAKEGYVRAGKGGKVVYIKADSRVAQGAKNAAKNFTDANRAAGRSSLATANAACQGNKAKKNSKGNPIPGTSTYRECMSKALGTKGDPRKAAAQVKAAHSSRVAKAVEKAKAPAKKKAAAKKKGKK